MTLEDLSLIAQIASVLLVPASLVFVGMQMRQTHAIERGNAQRDLLNQTRDWWMTCVRDEAIFDAYRAGLADYASLSRYQKARFSTLSFNLFHIVEGIYLQDKVKLLTDKMSEGYYIAPMRQQHCRCGQTSILSSSFPARGGRAKCPNSPCMRGLASIAILIALPAACQFRYIR